MSSSFILNTADRERLTAAHPHVFNRGFMQRYGLLAGLLAVTLKADMLVILTDVPQVCVQYGTAQQRGLDRMLTSEASSLLAAGEFPAGSMRPKIEAAIDFVTRRPAGRTLITDAANLLEGLRGRAGTTIVKE